MLEIKPLLGLPLDFPHTNLDFLHTNLVLSSIYNEVDSRFLKEHNRLASTCREVTWARFTERLLKGK